MPHESMEHQNLMDHIEAESPNEDIELGSLADLICDPLDVAARIEGIAIAYRQQATLFLGRRRTWRLNRADELMVTAWSLIEA